MNKKTKIVLIASFGLIVIAGISYVAKKKIELQGNSNKAIEDAKINTFSANRNEVQQPREAKEVEGVISAFGENTITLQSKDNNIELKLKPGRSLYIIKASDEKREMLTLADLKVGDNIKLQTDENNEILTITVQ